MRSLFDRPTGVPGWQAWAGAHRRAKAPESSRGQRRFPVPDGCSELIDSPRAPLCAGAVFCCSRGHETQPWSPPIAVPWGGETWNPDTREGGGGQRAVLGSDASSARTWCLPTSLRPQWDLQPQPQFTGENANPWAPGLENRCRCLPRTPAFGGPGPGACVVRWARLMPAAQAAGSAFSL